MYLCLLAIGLQTGQANDLEHREREAAQLYQLCVDYK